MSTGCDAGIPHIDNGHIFFRQSTDLPVHTLSSAGAWQQRSGGSLEIYVRERKRDGVGMRMSDGREEDGGREDRGEKGNGYSEGEEGKGRREGGERVR